MKNIHVIPTNKPSRLVKHNITSERKLFSGMIKSNPAYTTQHLYITNSEEIKEGDWFYLDMSHSGTLPDEIHQMGSDGWSKTGGIHFCEGNSWVKSCKKIILTTDQDLIGVQAIDDKFLEWFVKNPNCEFVEYDKSYNRGNGKYYYKVIIPKEEPKPIHQQIIDVIGGEDKFREIAKIEPKQRLEKYSERFDNDKSPIGNPETWGKRIVEEPKQETVQEAAERLFPDKMSSYEIFLLGAKWQAKRSYSEEEVKIIIFKFTNDFDMKKNIEIKSEEQNKWFEQFKKK